MRNKGGRPRKIEGGKNKQVHVRISEGQHLLLKKLEQQSGLTRSDLFVRRVLEDQHYLITADVLTTLQSLGLELSRIGNNLNQIAHQVNSARLNGGVNGNPPVDPAGEDFLAYTNLQSELVKLFRQMYRAMKEK